MPTPAAPSRLIGCTFVTEESVVGLNNPGEAALLATILRERSKCNRLFVAANFMRSAQRIGVFQECFGLLANADVLTRALGRKGH